MDLRRHTDRFGNYSECEFDEGQIFGHELVVSGRDTPTWPGVIGDPTCSQHPQHDYPESVGRRHHGNSNQIDEARRHARTSLSGWKRMLFETRKRHAHALANRTATNVQNAADEGLQNENGEKSKSA
jgi:acyl-CoA reductase-like NAD-dependent aldehyde dehydrogenase